MPQMPVSPRSVRAFAPASVGNFSAGFDFLGAALAPTDGTRLGNVVEATLAETDRLTWDGPHAHRLPADPRENLVLATRESYRAALATRGLPMQPVALHLEMRLPPGSGLGSSASSIVATLVALQVLHGHPLEPDAVLRIAGQVEGARGGGLHLDNVAPALLGGLRLVMETGESGALDTRALPWLEDLRVVVAHPGLELPTAEGRRLLPASLSLSLAITFSRNAASLVHALHVGDRTALSRSLWDPVAEPHRAHLVPGFASARGAALAAGALSCGLSGSGPSLFAVVEPACAEAVAAALRSALAVGGQEVRTWICMLDDQGARLVAENPCA
jgi:homoserine kinase